MFGEPQIVRPEARRPRRFLLYFLPPLLLIFLIGLPFTPLTNSGYRWAMQSGDQEFMALQFDRAISWYQAAHLVRPWLSTPNQQITLARETKQDLRAGRSFFQAHQNTKVLTVLDLIDQPASAQNPLDTAKNLAKDGFPDVSAQILRLTAQENPTDLPSRQLLVELDLKLLPPPKDELLKLLDETIALDPTNELALQQSVALQPNALYQNRLDIITALK